MAWIQNSGASQAARTFPFISPESFGHACFYPQVGAFLTSPAQCAPVNPPSNLDPPLVVISAPDSVGNCDDLILESSATSASIGTSTYFKRAWCCEDLVTVENNSKSTQHSC